MTLTKSEITILIRILQKATGLRGLGIKTNIDKIFNGTGNGTVSDLMGAQKQLFKVKNTVRPEWICMRMHCTIG
jgi:hypothetical protein